MQYEEQLVVGDKVDLLGHQNRLYRTMIEDSQSQGFFLVGIPRYAGIPMPLRLDESVYMIFYRETGRYITQMKCIKFEHVGEVKYIWLYQMTEPVKNQRRDAFRVPIIASTVICQYTSGLENNLPIFGGIEVSEVERTTTRDISTTGASFISDRKYEVGDKCLLMLLLNWPQSGTPPFHTCAQVIRVRPWRDSGRYIVGVLFFGQTKEMTGYISKFVLDEQRRQLKQKRLIEN